MKYSNCLSPIFCMIVALSVTELFPADTFAADTETNTSNISLLLLTKKKADFGDLDDASFPTKRKTQNCAPGRSGPYHLNVTHEWIGMALSSTTDKELDARVIDNDFDDGVVNIYTVNTCGTDCSIGMVSVSVGRDSDPAIRFLNVAADLNHDGHFAMYPAAAGKFQHEWLIINLPVMTPNRQSMIGSSFRIIDTAVLTQTPCVRVTLTTEMIDPALFGPQGWDGSGPAHGFMRGETEDQCPLNSSDPFLSHPWTTGTGVKFPVYDQDPPAVAYPPPNGPFIDEPGGQPVVDLPPPPEKKDIYSYPPEAPEQEDASKPFAEPPVTTEKDPFPYKAVIDNPKMADNKQTGENDCMPTAAANSIEYLLNKAKVDAGLNHGDLKDVMSPSAEPPNDPEGMMDAPDGTGTTVSGFRRGKQLAGTALAAHGKGLKTSTTQVPSFLNIYNAVQEGKDVEIAISYEKSTPPVGHAVIVTGVTMDQHGNMTLTFVDPGNEAAGEQVYTITNGAGAGDPRAINNGGLKVNNFPGAGEKIAVIKHLFVEELVDVTPP